MENYPEHIIKEIESHIVQGKFVFRKLGVWRGGLTYSLPANGLGVSGVATITFKSSPMKTKYRINLRTLLFEVKKVFKFYSYNTRSGFFVPRMNIEFFDSQMPVVKEMIYRFRDETLENYDTIIEELKDRYRELAFWVWANQYKNVGDPPTSFVLDFCEKAISKNHTKSIVKKRFKFEDSHTRPPLADEEVRSIAIAVYRQIIKRRRGLTYYALKKRRQFLEATNSRGPRKLMCKYFSLWKNLVFYEDNELLEIMEGIRRMAILGYDSTNEDMAEALRKLIRYLMDHEDYRLEIEYDGGQKI